MDAQELSDLDFEQRITKLFSFVSLLYNKRLSPVALMLILVETPQLRTLFSQTTEMTFFELTRKLAYMYPVLYKSKKLEQTIASRRLFLTPNQ